MADERRWGQVGSNQVPWRYLRDHLSTAQIKQIRADVETPAFDRKPEQVRRIQYAMDVGDNKKRHQRNIAIAGPGTRIRTSKGVRTVR